MANESNNVKNGLIVNKKEKTNFKEICALNMVALSFKILRYC